MTTPQRIIALLCAIYLTCDIHAQKNEIFNDHIATVQVVAGDDWLSPPVVSMNGQEGNNVINIGFDDLTHTYHRYTYTIEHCEADWSKSEDLFQSDYVDGFAEGNTIDDNEESLNTNVLYTHYSLQIPNDKCRLKMSGNYKLTVYDENNNNEKMLTACFMVVDKQMGIQMDVTTNTDVDVNNSHQQVAMQVNYGSINVTDPSRQIKTVVMQNNRLDNAKINVKPQYIMSNGLRWDHCRDLIFDAGNEYHKFEALDVDHPTLGIDRIGWDGKDYNVYLIADEPRPNYLYDEDADGAFYIRNSNNVENDRASEYVLVHYKLKCPYQNNIELYVNGDWTNDSFTSKYEMKYDFQDNSWNATIQQKQGYYSYRYIAVDDTGTYQPEAIEPAFYQTENKYQCFVYFRGPTDRTDQLVGYQQIKTR